MPTPPPAARPAPCPHCGAVPARRVVLRWGAGQSWLACAPYLCQACGGLALVALATGRLLALGYNEEAYLRAHAPALWEVITTARATAWDWGRRLPVTPHVWRHAGRERRREGRPLGADDRCRKAPSGRSR